MKSQTEGVERLYSTLMAEEARLWRRWMRLRAEELPCSAVTVQMKGGEKSLTLKTDIVVFLERDTKRVLSLSICYNCPRVKGMRVRERKRKRTRKRERESWS